MWPYCCFTSYGVWTNGGDPLSELTNWPHPLYDSWTLCPIDGCSAVLGAKVGYLWFGSILIGKRSMGITETPMGTGCSRVLRLLVWYNSSDTPLRWWTLWYSHSARDLDCWWLYFRFGGHSVLPTDTLSIERQNLCSWVLGWGLGDSYLDLE